jgi:galactose mutarotase-like enzyme
MTRNARASLDWTYRGMRTLILENSFLRAVYLLDKGGDLIELRYKPLDVDLLWHAPQGHVNPNGYVQSIATAESSFNDLYGGGWQDAIPVIGNGPQEHRGAKYGTHGESPVMRWDCQILEGEGSSASATLSVQGIRYPFRLEKAIRIEKDQPVLQIEEKLSNLSPQALEFFWLQHPAFGEPFLSQGDKISLPEQSEIVNFEDINPNGRIAGGRFQWPFAKSRRSSQEIDLSIVPSRDIIAEETCFIKVKNGRYEIQNQDLGLSFELDWDPLVFGWVWFWQNYNMPDYPYYGDAWNIAIEPATSPPTDITKKNGDKSGLKIPGRSSITTALKARIRSFSPQS